MKKVGYFEKNILGLLTFKGEEKMEKLDVKNSCWNQPLTLQNSVKLETFFYLNQLRTHIVIIGIDKELKLRPVCLLFGNK